MAEDRVERGPIVVFAIMLTLFAAALMDRLRRCTSITIPFTLSMLLFGMAVGGLTHTSPSFRSQVDSIATVEPELILHIFLPILMYDGAYGLKVSVLAKVFGPSLVLAAPGVAINTMFVALVAKLAFYTSWTWYQAVLFGVLLSATDPVAVLATLKDLDADIRATVLTDGEAILNDGTSIVLFSVLLPAASINGSIEVNAELFGRLINFLVTPYFLGKVMGIILFFVLARCQKFPVLAAVLQFSAAYVVFYVADVLCCTSGVLTLLAMGVHMHVSSSDRPRRESDHVVESFWEIVVWIANAAIFALVGFIIAAEALPFARGTDVAYLFALYPLLFVFRAVMLAMLTPLLNFLNPGLITWRRYILLVHGALRGAIALALALIVFQDRDVPMDYRRTTLFLTAGIVLLTVALNGSTAGLVVGYLHLNLKPIFSRFAYGRASREIAAAMEAVIYDRKYGESVGTINWALLRDLTVEEFRKLRRWEPLSELGASLTVENVVVPSLLRAMKRELLRERDAGKISGRTLRSFLSFIEHFIVDNALFTEKDVRKWLDQLSLSRLERLMQRLPFTCFTPPAVVRIEAALALREITSVEFHTVTVLHSRRLNLGQETEWVRTMRHFSRRLLEELREADADLMAVVCTKRAAQDVLASVVQDIQNVSRRAGLSNQQRLQLEHTAQQLVTHNASRVTDQLRLVPPHVMLYRHPIFAPIYDDGEASDAMQGLIDQTHSCPEGTVMPIGAQDVCMVLSGHIIKVSQGRVLNRFTTGDVFGLLRAYCDCAKSIFLSVTDTKYVILNRGVIDALAAKHPAFRNSFWHFIATTIVEQLLAQVHPTNTLQYFERWRLARGGSLTFHDQDTAFTVSHRSSTTFLLAGCDTSRRICSRGTLVVPCCLEGVWTAGTVTYNLGGIVLLGHHTTPTGIPFVDHATTATNLALTGLHRAVEEEVEDLRPFLPILADQLSAFAAIDHLLGEYGLRDDHYAVVGLLRKMAANVQWWVRLHFIVKVDRERIIRALEEFVDTFFAPDCLPWADELHKRGQERMRTLFSAEDVLSPDDIRRWAAERQADINVGECVDERSLNASMFLDHTITPATIAS